MKESLFIICATFLTNLLSINAQNYVIPRQGGKIIQAYKNFDDFIHSDKTWDSYKKLVFEACPEMIAIHNRQLSWGTIDTVSFPDKIMSYTVDEWSVYLNRYNEKTVIYLYDSIVQKANQILPPDKISKTDLCFFLPYGGCFVEAESTRNLICISMLINPSEVGKIITHEYAHCLHMQRRPKEPYSLKREIVSEGMAVYLTTLVMNDKGIENAIPFMPASSFEWCLSNEQKIKDSIIVDLNDTTMYSMKKYIADGIGFSTPPPGFVEKTAYFAGYQVIKACVEKGMKLEEICALTSEEVITKSGYFF